MGFYAKDEATTGAGDLATADPQYSLRKCKPRNAIPPISTVGVGLRFYSPALGRWMSRDPIGERGGVYLYVYCENQGVQAIDPLGLVISWPQLVDIIRHSLPPAAAKALGAAGVLLDLKHLGDAPTMFAKYEIYSAVPLPFESDLPSDGEYVDKLPSGSCDPILDRPRTCLMPDTPPMTVEWEQRGFRRTQSAVYWNGTMTLRLRYIEWTCACTCVEPWEPFGDVPYPGRSVWRCDDPEKRAQTYAAMVSLKSPEVFAP